MDLWIAPAGPDDLEQTLPLIARYQRFYGVEEPDETRNRAFWTRLLAPSERGVLLVARAGADDGPVSGFATVYWSWDSISATDTAVLYDLFVEPDARGGGIGRALIERAAAEAHARGLETLSWSTAIDNRPAQRLYETFAAERSAWFEYTLRSAPGRT